jgi:hypothetical protein
MTSKKQNWYLYRAFGINIASEIECPELLEGGYPVDVQIKSGTVPETLTGDFISGLKFCAKPDQLLIHTNTIAKISVSNGSRVTVEPRPGAKDYEVRLLLLGWGLGGLLQQRDLLPLHGAAVKVGDESLIFCADAKVGKSTLTAAFVRNGYQFLDDNIIAIQEVGGHLFVIPGYPQILLWDDALDHLGIQPEVLRPVRPNRPKYALDYRDMFHENPLPIGAVYILTPISDSKLSITTLSGSGKFAALSAQVFCRRFMNGMGKAEFLFNSLINLSNRIEVKRVHIPEKRPAAHELTEILVGDYYSQPA